MNEHSPRAVLLSLIGLILCTLPVTLAILSYFPIWIERGGAETVSGFVLLLLVLAAIPLLRSIKHRLRSPAAYTVWLIGFLLFFALSKRANEMTVICFVGFIGNLVGALFFRAAKRMQKKVEGDEE